MLFVFLLKIITYLSVNTINITEYTPVEGDLVFQDLDCDSVCDAIEDVTNGLCNAKVSHVGIIVIKNDSIFVLEAIEGKVKFSYYDEFLNRSLDENGRPKVMVFRVKDEYRYLIPAVIKGIDRYNGKPYDYFFDFNNDSIYCSELIYFLFKEANNNIEFFNASPMTFKSAKTGLFNDYWINYFKSYSKEIPEGQLGINPASISRSDKIELIYLYGNIKNSDKECLSVKLKKN